MTWINVQVMCALKKEQITTRKTSEGEKNT